MILRIGDPRETEFEGGSVNGALDLIDTFSWEDKIEAEAKEIQG